MNAVADWLVPDWGGRVLPGVHSMVTTRNTLPGDSRPPFDHFNLAGHVGDDPAAVAANRARLRSLLPAEPLWLDQVHGITVLAAEQAVAGMKADASFARAPGVVCAVMSADCLPLLLAARDGSVVAAAHAGWRGMANGVIEATLAALGLSAEEIVAWLGPAIGSAAFDVGDDVRVAFLQHDAQAALAFHALGQGKWLCDLYRLARQRLLACGVPAAQISGGDLCTYADARRFYSWRRDGRTGRMVSLIWRAA